QVGSQGVCVGALDALASSREIPAGACAPAVPHACALARGQGLGGRGEGTARGAGDGPGQPAGPPELGGPARPAAEQGLSNAGGFAVRYELSHLVQDPTQAVFGPIQDDEALLLFAVCRVTCARRVAEFGGESGYSARNFLAAVGGLPGAAVYTVDAEPVPVLSPAHKFVHKLAKDVVPEDFDARPLDLVFFDCHDFAQQMRAFRTLSEGSVITRATLVAVHDTGPHPEKLVPWAYRGEGGYLHRPEERAMVTALQDLGYECISFH